MQSANASELTTDIAVIGGGAAGIGVIASLLKRSPGLRISLIEPADTHYYQPGWTLVGGGAYAQGDTARPMAGLVPPGVEWLRTRVERVDPEARRLLLEGGDSLEYRNLIVCPGLRLAWERIEGLEETLGRNGVTSNYRYDLAPYTWELVRGLRGGKALFTQPAMPIKCAGAPQKAMYLSCDHWLREGVLQDIEVEFDLAGAALFGVADFVPPLMEYVRKYSAELAFNSNLVKVDGAARKAWFEVKDADGNTNLAEKDFDLLHVVPPQCWRSSAMPASCCRPSRWSPPRPAASPGCSSATYCPGCTGTPCSRAGSGWRGRGARPGGSPRPDPPHGRPQSSWANGRSGPTREQVTAAARMAKASIASIASRDSAASPAGLSASRRRR